MHKINWDDRIRFYQCNLKGDCLLTLGVYRDLPKNFKHEAKPPWVLGPLSSLWDFMVIAKSSRFCSCGLFSGAPARAIAESSKQLLR